MRRNIPFNSKKNKIEFRNQKNYLFSQIRTLTLT